MRAAVHMVSSCPPQFRSNTFHVKRQVFWLPCNSSESDVFPPPLVLLFRYRVSLFSKWKQRGMYATCMWIVQLLLQLSKKDRIFRYIPEFYVETLVSH